MPYIRSYPEPSYPLLSKQDSQSLIDNLPTDDILAHLLETIREFHEAARELHNVDYNPDAPQHDMVKALNDLYELAGIEVVRLS